VGQQHEVRTPIRDRSAQVDADDLGALVRLAALVTASTGAHELIEAVAETARELLRANSLSISRLDSDPPVLRTVINVGEVGVGEQRWPANESYEIDDFPDTLGFLVGRPVRHVATHVDDPDAEPAEVALLRSLGKTSSLKTAIVVDGRVWGELWASRRDGHPPFEEYDGAVAGVIVGLVSAGLAQANAWQRMEQLALTDPLTGLANRRAFDEHLTRFLGRTRTAGEPLAVAVADVNGLKRLNDTRGHAAGDDALRHTAAAAAHVVRSWPGALATRLGGDEFALVLPGGHPDDAHAVAAQWCTLADHPRYGTSIACGLAVTDRSDPSPTAAALLRAADRAQYRAKTSGSAGPVLVRPEPDPGPSS
jgi:diguanylate cyclase (GGDEF)-like protein